MKTDINMVTNITKKMKINDLLYATRCIEAGIHPKVLQQILGHSDISITLNTYCDAFENFQNENITKTDEYFSNMGIKFGQPQLLRVV